MKKISEFIKEEPTMLVHGKLMTMTELGAELVKWQDIAQDLYDSFVPVAFEYKLKCCPALDRFREAKKNALE